MNELARALFEAHVAHELRSHEERPDNQGFERMTARAFEWLAGVRLEDVLSTEQVMGVIDRYVIELKISGGIAELAGQMTQIIFASEASADTRIDQLLSYDTYRGFADKIEGLEGAQHEVIQLLTRTRSFLPLLARGVALAMRNALLERDIEPEQASGTSKLARLGRELKSELAARFEAQLTHYCERHADRLAHASEQHLRELITPDTLRSLADELWDAVSGMRLSELFSFLGASDIDEFVVLSYEAWLHYRQTPYFRVVCQQVVQALYAKYGGESVLTLLEDMGVNETMIAQELRALFAPLISYAADTGYLEQSIRRRLEPFYRSGDVASLLASRG